MADVLLVLVPLAMTIYAVIDAIQNGLEDVYPGAMAEGLLAGLRADAKAVERELAGYLPAGD